jgi:hypothetical protein
VLAPWMELITDDRGYDNVLFGRGYRTASGAVLDVCVCVWSIGGRMISRGNSTQLERERKLAAGPLRPLPISHAVTIIAPFHFAFLSAFLIYF